MKKILTLMVAVFALVVGGMAQNHEGLSLLNVRALHTGTNSLGLTGLSITNLDIIRFGSNAGVVLHTNITFTNMAGQVVRSAGAAGGTNTVSTFKLFNAAPLYVDRDGKPIYSSVPLSGNPTFNATNYPVSPQTLSVRLANPFGSNGVIGINFTPLWDGTNASSKTDDDWSISIAYALAGIHDIRTNVPTWKWPGAKAFAVRNITNSFAAGGEVAVTIVTNSPAITEMKVYGFRP